MEFIKKFLSIGKYVERRNVNSLYMHKKYKDTAHYAKKNREIDGVTSLAEQLDYDYEDYCKQMDALLEGKHEKENRCYTLWNRVHKVKNISFIVGVAGFAICFLLGILASFVDAPFVSFFNDVCVCSGLLSGLGSVVFLVSKILEMVVGSIYAFYVKRLEKKVSGPNEDYVRRVNQIYNEIDDLYLASLDPTQREIVLMRRDQERQHQELLKLKKKQNQEQNKYNRESLDEQQRTRKAQEKLLAIELERERRSKAAW